MGWNHKKTASTVAIASAGVLFFDLREKLADMIPTEVLTFVFGIALSYLVWAWRAEIRKGLSYRPQRRKKEKPAPRKLMRHEYELAKTVQKSLGGLFKTWDEWEREEERKEKKDTDRI